MSRKLTGPDLVAYLRQFPTSDDRQWAADEIERQLAERDGLGVAVKEAAEVIVDRNDEIRRLQDALLRTREYLKKCPPHLGDHTGAEWGRVMDESWSALSREQS